MPGVTTITLRTGSPADAPAIAAIYEPYVTGSAISFELTPPTSDLITARMAATPRLPWWVAVDGGAVVGFAYASPHRTRAAYRWSVEVSVYVASSHHGLGAGGALYRRLLSDLRGLGYVSAYAGITLPNSASVRLHERAGFTRTGVFRNAGYKHGRWHDVGWWYRPLIDPPPTDPTDLSGDPDGSG